MDILEVMKSRHSVRQYTDKKIECEKRKVLNEFVKECNAESGMNIQIIYDEPKCFDSIMAHYGKFSGCTNYIAVVGKKSKDLDEKAGYYGEKLVLKAQELGLNTCWVAITRGNPTAMNQQKFKFTLNGDQVEAVATGGLYSKIDLGIVKYHFEVASGHKVN